MIQRIYMGDGARGRSAFGLSADRSAARLMCGGHPMSEVGLGRRAGDNWQIRVQGNQVSDR